MSRGHGVVQRFILDYLAAGHPEPDKRLPPGLGPRPRRPELIGHPLYVIAAAYRGMPRDRWGHLAPDRSTMASFGRAMATLRAAGLIEVRHKRDHPHLRIVRAPNSATALLRSSPREPD
jgi:hypothetical protein